MDYLLVFAILFVIYLIVWIAGLFLYSIFVGGIDFGAMGVFALKSAALVAVVAGVMLIPFGGWLALLVWWVGAVALFGMEFWEAKVLVLIVWGLSFLLRLALIAALAGAR